MTPAQRYTDPSPHHAHVRRDMQYALIASLSLCIAFIFIVPQPDVGVPTRKFGSEAIVTIIDLHHVEVTRQYARPVPPRPEVQLAALDAPMLPDAAIDSEANDAHARGPGRTPGDTVRGAHGQRGIWMPRQLLEVLPESSTDGSRGDILLSLVIGRDGSVLRHIVVSNTTGSRNALEKAIHAAYASKWEQFPDHAQVEEFTIRKRYRIK